jgi:hypothetical protein
LLDEHGEALLIDLRKYFNIDLVAFLRGEVACSPRLILTFIRHLPEGANYVAALRSAPATELPDTSETEIDPVLESMTWTTDRLLQAQLINSVNMLVRHTIQWQDGKAPEFPLVGPESWRGGGEKTSKPSKQLSVMDVINNVMGHS